MRFKQPRDLRRRFYSALRSPPAAGGGLPPPRLRRRPSPSSPRRARRRRSRRRASGRLGASEIGMVASSSTMSARLPDREGADRPLQGLRAAGERRGEQPAAGRFAPAVMTLRARCVRRWPYSSCRSSAAASIWMLESVPTPKRRRPRDSPRRRRCRRRDGLGHRTEAGDRAGRRERADLVSVVCVAWIRHQRRSTRRCRAATPPAGARPRRRIPRLPSSARRRGCGSGRPASPGRRRATCPASPRAANAGRCRPALPAGSPRWRGCARPVARNRSGSLRKRRWPAAGRRAAESAIGVERRQQRQADAGLACARRRCAPPSRRDRRRAGRPTS